MCGHRPSQSVDQTSLMVALPLTLAAFFVAFACWTLFAVLGVQLRHQFALSHLEFALLLAMPMLSGGLVAFPLGVATQRFGGRRVILACLLALMAALLLLSSVHSYTGFLVAGLGLGAAGGLFSAGLQYLVTYLPPSRAGLVLGVFGVGVSGAGFSYLIVPVVERAYSWQLAPLAYVLVLVVIALLLLVLTDPEPTDRSQRPLVSLGVSLRFLARSRVWRLCLYFSFLFGGLVGLGLWLPDYLSTQFQLSLEDGARWSLLFALPVVLAQIAGGIGADRFGAVTLLRLVLLLCLVPLFLLSYPDTDLAIAGIERTILLSIRPSLDWVVVGLVLLSFAMGLGLGALLRLLFDEYPRHLGVVGGLMLAAACTTAFLLPLMFGLAVAWVGVASAVFMMLFVFGLCTWVVLEWASRSDRCMGPLPPTG